MLILSLGLLRPFSFSVVHDSASGRLRGSVSQQVLTLCHWCHIWPLLSFYSCNLFLPILIPHAGLSSQRGVYILTSWDLWSWRHAGWAFPPCTPSPQKKKTLVPERKCPSGSYSLSLWSPPPPQLPALLCGCADITLISQDISRWQHLPPCALRLD